MPRHEPFAHAMQTAYAARGWAPWPHDAVQEAESDVTEGPGLLVSRAFWVGGGLSLLLWVGVTLLALQWI